MKERNWCCRQRGTGVCPHAYAAEVLKPDTTYAQEEKGLYCNDWLKPGMPFLCTFQFDPQGSWLGAGGKGSRRSVIGTVGPKDSMSEGSGDDTAIAQVMRLFFDNPSVGLMLSASCEEELMDGRGDQPSPGAEYWPRLGFV